MKKMIAIAAIALSGAVFAATSCNTCPTATPCNTCNTCNVCGDKCGWGYKLKVLLKTTATKSATKVVNTCACNTCTTCTGSCYRKPVTKKYLGYFFGRTNGSTCSGCECNNWEYFNFVLWNYDANKEPVLVSGLELLQFNRFGESQGSMVELAFTLGADVNVVDLESQITTLPMQLAFAGFGNIGERSNGTKAIKSISGFCAGVIPCYCNETTKNACGTITSATNRLSTVWTICGTKYYSQSTAAYGKWVLAWDSPIVNAITAGKIKFEQAEPTSGEEAEGGDTEAKVFRAISGFTPAGFKAGYRFYGEGFKLDGEYKLAAYASAKFDGDKEDTDLDEEAYKIWDYLWTSDVIEPDK